MPTHQNVNDTEATAIRLEAVRKRADDLATTMDGVKDAAKYIEGQLLRDMTDAGMKSLETSRYRYIIISGRVHAVNLADR